MGSSGTRRPSGHDAGMRDTFPSVAGTGVAPAWAAARGSFQVGQDVLDNGEGGLFLCNQKFKEIMATINYITLKVPQILFANIELIQSTPTFEVYRYKRQKGIIFRLPHGLKGDMLCHCFLEHEINLSNTLKTGTLTLKVQCTFVPVHMGVFSGFKELKGKYHTQWVDEGDYESEEETFVPDYNNPENEVFVAPLPIGVRSNLGDYLNEILFDKVEDVNILHDYAVNLGCQKDTVRKATYIASPELHSKLPTEATKKKHLVWQDFFAAAENSNINLLPPKAQLNLGI